MKHNTYQFTSTPHNSRVFGSDWLIMKYTLLGKQSVFPLYLAIQSRDFNETSNLAVDTYTLQLAWVSLRSVDNDGQFTWEAKCFVLPISASIQRTFMKIHTQQTKHMFYKEGDFGCLRSITRASLLVEQNAFPCVPQLALEACYPNSTQRMLRACATHNVSLI